MAENPVAEVAGNLFGGIVGGAGWVVLLIFGIGLIGGLMYYFLIYRRKFSIMVKITSERASDPRMFFDKAAILYDRKTKSKYFKLFDTKVELQAPPFKILESTNKGDYLELYRKSEDDFVYLTKPTIDKEKIIKTDGKVYPIASTKQRQIEGDIYWIIKRKEEDKKWLSTESLLAKLIEWAPQIISGFFMIIILFIFMQKLPEIISQLSELVSRLQTLEGAVAKAG